MESVLMDQNLDSSWSTCDYTRNVTFFYNLVGKEIRTVWTTRDIVVIGLGLTVCVIVSLANIMVMVAIFVNHRFHFPIYYLLGNMAAADLFAGMAYANLMLNTGPWTSTLTKQQWYVRGALIDISLTASVGSLLAVAVERHQTVITMQLHSTMTRRRVVLLIAGHLGRERRHGLGALHRLELRVRPEGLFHRGTHLQQALPGVLGRTQFVDVPGHGGHVRPHLCHCELQEQVHVPAHGRPEQQPDCDQPDENHLHGFRSVRGLLDSGPGDSPTGRAAGPRQPRQHVREVLPGDGGVQLSGQPRHLRSARPGDAPHVQVDPVLPVRKEAAEGSLAAGVHPSTDSASGTR
ncbi:unnamed protein product [Tetraodon nigroviridis]|uniref:Chromosome undetermined SCAF9631, whole genome shotgun sequence n=1 Tax=Tetraodon nigroviridis TaxID=99883 RepID=Q4T4I5_TETNG|nr:unnamed protein product [Tetraodon nigroviridis]